MGESGCVGVVHYGMAPLETSPPAPQRDHARLDVRLQATMQIAMTAVGSHTQQNSEAMTCHPRSLKKRAPIGETAMG